jgi:hypothetical protein
MNRLRYYPLHRADLPAYPTKLAALADPALLRKHLPSAWLGRREMAGAAALFLAGGTLGGAGGCVWWRTPPGIVAPPSVCLSEEDALQIIRDELQQQGLTLGEENVALTAVQLADSSGETAPLQADLADTQRGLAVEYLDDASYWSYRSYADEENAAPADVADALVAAAATQAPELRLGVFSTELNETGDCDAAAAEVSLREQVRDFVDWLKAQGVI